MTAPLSLMFDWTGLQLEDELWTGKALGGLDKPSTAVDRATGLQFAMKFYSSTGHDAAREGEHRSLILWDVAMALWWEWAAEDEDFVMTVLRHVNAQFPEAKEEEVLVKKMQEAHARTVGDRRKEQINGGYGWRREPSNTSSVASIKHHAKRLKQRHKPEIARLGEEMWRMIEGDTISDDPGTWRSALTRVAHELAQTFVNDKRERITDFFKPSLETMRRTGSPVPSLEEIEGWVGGRIEGEKKRRVEREARLKDDVRKTISSATGGKRETKYTQEEVETWSSPNGCGLDEKSWLLQCGKGTYVFLDGTWVGPYTEVEFDAQGYTDLEAAADFVRTKTYNEEKGTWACTPLKALLQKYGSRCTTEVEYACDRSWFRKEDHTLMLQGPERNILEARFHTDVDQWIRVVTGRATPANEKTRQDEARVSGTTDGYDALCNWMACVPQPLDHPLSACVITGKKGGGKKLIADGLARLWKGGKITLTAAAGQFNSLLLKSPFIVVDEGLPPGMSATALLRRMLSEEEHVYTRKNVDSGKIRGCVRMLFTANNLDIFNDPTSKEKLQQNDVGALSDRFIHIEMGEEARIFLNSLGPKHHDFVKKNMIAEHALWLSAKRLATIQARDLRFMVEGHNENVSNVVATNVDSTSDVCNVLAKALSEERRNVDWFAVQNGELWVHAPSLRDQVGLHNNQARHTERDIIRAVSSVSTKNATMRIGGKLLKRKMWCFKLDALKAWCDNTKYGWEEVAAGLAKLNVEVTK